MLGSSSNSIAYYLMFFMLYFLATFCLKKKTKFYWVNYKYPIVFIQYIMVFPVVMYGCESWTKKKTEHQRIDTFKLWCWRRLLRVPWSTRRSNQSILKEIILNIHWKDWSWSAHTLTTCCEEPIHWGKKPQCLERLKEKGEEDGRGWDS